MSWIFGFSGDLSQQKKISYSSLYPVPSVIIDEPRLYMVAGGTKYSCYHSADQKWIVLGTGLKNGSDNFSLMKETDWEKIILENSIREPFGHYIVIKWSTEGINLYSDHIGLRTVYFYKNKFGVYFSTSLKWISTIMDKVEIDFKEFGSRWILFNQLSNRSYIYDVEKLPPASSAFIKNGQIKIETGNWFPPLSHSEPEDLFHLIRKYLSLRLPDDLKLTLGLSGGLDSRFLLSFLLQNNPQQYNIHSCGYNDNADLQVAKNISDKLALKCFFLRPDNFGSGQLFNKMGEYAGDAELAEPVMSYLQFSVFDNKYFNNKFLIDGALAEFARRQFLNRLLIKGKTALINKNHRQVIKYLILPKPDIFKNEYNEMMLDSAAEQMKHIFEQFPDPNDTGAENFVDLLVFKFRIPNYFGPEQARLDNLLPGFMPFAQRNTISASLGIPLKLRKNSNLFYKAIQKNYPPLGDFPLVKNSITYPYGLSSVASYAYTRMKRSVKSNADTATLNFFIVHEKAIREFITRDAVREYKPYDEEAVMSIVNDFYSGKKNSASNLNWLLTFEMFRQKLNITGS